jgi:selenocysteine-specific elongation factor
MASQPEAEPGKSLVLGTAGHIDHGKTSLVRALTGRDLDRLPEEKARGITIELGFAPLTLPDGQRLALVDVPGHERFVRTMVAGASGLDLVMLVVAADEGVMPQTREHLAICELLGVEQGIVVLTKADLVDEEMIELATEELRDTLAEGPLAQAPILPASAETGEGIDAVREALSALAGAAPAHRDDDRAARLFVDRVFTKHGFGAVVTGTWSGRPRKTGDAVVLEPGGRKVRIRGLERHGEAVEETQSGARIAVNLQGINTEEVSRGDLLTEPDALLPTTTFDARVHWLSSRLPLEDSVAVELLTGTTERRARVALVGETPLGEGDRGYARVHVDGPPLPLLPGDRFVVRGFARDAGVGSTLGGGVVLDVAPPHRRRRDPILARDLERLAGGDREDGLLVRIERTGLEGARTDQLALETGLPRQTLEAGLEALAQAKKILRLDAGRSLGADAASRLTETLVETLEAFHAREPQQPGMPRAALTGSLPSNVPREAGALLLDRLVAGGTLTREGEIVSRAGFESRLDEDERAVADAIAEQLREAGLDAPALRTLAETLEADESRVRTVAHFLERQGELVAAPDELFFDRASVLDLIDRVIAHFEASDELDTQTLKAMIGTSRRTAMPLMALLDDLQITRRDGSLRRLLGTTPRWSSR